MEKRILIASWLFLIGSSLFLMDSMFEVTQQFSPISLLHLSEGVLFLMGSIFFMPLSSSSSPSPSEVSEVKFKTISSRERSHHVVS